jgi:putative addiction module component (TIGR02574 family)
MNNEEKKQALQDLLSTADEGLTNILLEAAEAYQKKVQEEFILTDEYIAELERRSADLRSGKDKGFTYEEVLERTQKIFKEKYNVVYTPNIS